MSSPRDDDQLLRAFAGGDTRAFEELVGRYGGALKGYALRMLQSPQQAEEVYTETFLRVATHRGAWENRGTVRGWLFTIAHRLCIDILRQRKVARDAVPHLVDLSTVRPCPPSPEAQMVLRERAAMLEEGLARLPEEHRQVLLMRVVHGLSAAETGAALSLTESQVHSELSYARKRLREHLAEAEPERRLEER